MLCGCCVTIQIKWWRWRCVCMPQCRRCIHWSCIRLHWLNAYFLIPFCVVVRRTLCAASLKRVTVYHMEIVGNEILLYEFSLCELFSEDRIKLVNRGTPPPPMARQPLWVWASSLLRFLDHTRTHYPRYDTPGRVIGPSQRKRDYCTLSLYWNCARAHTACFSSC